MEYRDNNGAMEPVRVHTVVISVQHSPEVTLEKIRKDLMEKIVKEVIPAKYLDDRTIYHLLPSGKFSTGGPQVESFSICADATLWFCSFPILTVRHHYLLCFNLDYVLCGKPVSGI